MGPRTIKPPLPTKSTMVVVAKIEIQKHPWKEVEEKSLPRSEGENDTAEVGIKREEDKNQCLRARRTVKGKKRKK